MVKELLLRSGRAADHVEGVLLDVLSLASSNAHLQTLRVLLRFQNAFLFSSFRDEFFLTSFCDHPIENGLGCCSMPQMEKGRGFYGCYLPKRNHVTRMKKICHSLACVGK